MKNTVHFLSISDQPLGSILGFCINLKVQIVIPSSRVSPYCIGTYLWKEHLMAPYYFPNLNLLTCYLERSIQSASRRVADTSIWCSGPPISLVRLFSVSIQAFHTDQPLKVFRIKSDRILFRLGSFRTYYYQFQAVSLFLMSLL